MPRAEINDKARQSIVEIDIEDFATSMSFVESSQSEHQIIRSNRYHQKFEFHEMISALFTITINDIMNVVRDNIDDRITRHLKHHIEALRIEFDALLRKQVVENKTQLNVAIEQLIIMIDAQIIFAIVTAVNTFNQIFESVLYTSSDSSITNALKSKTNVLKSENIEYFDLDRKKKNHIVTSKIFYNFIVRVEKHIHYIEIYCFVERLKNLVKQYDQSINVSTNLVDDVIIWYIMKLTSLQRADFRINDMKQWYEKLINRFKMKTFKIMSHFINNRFNLISLKTTKSRIWIMHMRYLAKFVVFDFTFNQFIVMWNQLNVLLRRDILMSTSNTTLISFFEQLNDKISIWKKMIDRQQRQQLQNRQSQQQLVFNKHVIFKSSSSRVDTQAHMIEIEKISENYYVENEYSFN